jgi:hypothetical protein
MLPKNGSSVAMDFFDNNNVSDNDNMLETSDQLKKAWLVNFKGYSLESTRKEPQAGMFGNIRYKKIWILKKDGESSSNNKMG